MHSTSFTFDSYAQDYLGMHLRLWLTWFEPSFIRRGANPNCSSCNSSSTGRSSSSVVVAAATEAIKADYVARSASQTPSNHPSVVNLAAI